MSVSHCMHHALAIAASPRERWAEQIKALPSGCAHADCGEPRNCRERIAAYLRGQWHAKPKRREGGTG